MSCIVDNSTIFDVTNLSTNRSVLIDMSQIDTLSIGINVTASSGSNTLTCLESVDGLNFSPVAMLTITGTGTTIWHIGPCFSRYKKILYTAGTGSATFTVTINARNNSVNTAGVGLVKIIGTN